MYSRAKWSQCCKATLKAVSNARLLLASVCTSSWKTHLIRVDALPIVALLHFVLQESRLRHHDLGSRTFVRPGPKNTETGRSSQALDSWYTPPSPEWPLPAR
eukprot:scaffold318_cov269-Pinguiococcus_pyrenoidosus.AAC.9